MAGKDTETGTTEGRTERKCKPYPEIAYARIRPNRGGGKGAEKTESNRRSEEAYSRRPGKLMPERPCGSIFGGATPRYGPNTVVREGRSRAPSNQKEIPARTQCIANRISPRVATQVGGNPRRGKVGTRKRANTISAMEII